MRFRAVALLAAASLSLAACDDQRHSPAPPISSNPDEIGAIYSDMASCKESYTEQECKDFQLVAEQEHVKTAPKYVSNDECSRAYNNCVERRNPSTGESIFMPALVGFMVGNLLANGTRAAPQPVYYGPPPTGAASNTAEKSIYTGGGYVGRSQGTTVVATPQSTVSRGAFAAPLPRTVTAPARPTLPVPTPRSQAAPAAPQGPSSTTVAPRPSALPAPTPSRPAAPSYSAPRPSAPSAPSFRSSPSTSSSFSRSTSSSFSRPSSSFSSGRR